jgi:hypothetical protein
VRTFSRRRLTTAVAILFGVAGVAVAPGSAAVAAGSGTGWSAWWSYYTTRSFEIHGTLPGVKLTGYSSDDNGVRSAGLALEDTATDARCAHVYVVGQRDGRVATLVDDKVCDGQPYRTPATGRFTGAMGIWLSRFDPAGGFDDKQFYLEIPDSGPDPDLRSTNTGASFFFTDNSFVYGVQRNGVQLTGSGRQLGDDARSVLGTVKHTGQSGTCASAEATDNITVIGASTCTPGEQKSFASEADLPFGYDTFVQACTAPRAGGPSRCNWLTIPEPW